MGDGFYSRVDLEVSSSSLENTQKRWMLYFMENPSRFEWIWGVAPRKDEKRQR